MWRLVKNSTAANSTTVAGDVAAGNETQDVRANLTLLVEKGWALVKAGGEEGPAGVAAEDHNNGSHYNSTNLYERAAGDSYPGKQSLNYLNIQVF